MRKAASLLVLLAACAEPPKTGQMDHVITGLAHLHSWNPEQQAEGQYGYDAVIGRIPDILPLLVNHLTDPTPTAIYDDLSGRNPTVGDVCFLILLRAMNLRWQDFADDGVFLSTALPNPIFCIRWDDPVAKRRVQQRFRQLLPESGK